MQKPDDNRMLWIRGLLEDSKDLTDTIEIEFVSEKDIIGILKFKNILCNQTSLGSYYSPGLKSYLLKIKFKRDDIPEIEEINKTNPASKKGYYSASSWDELINIFSFFFQCRFWILNVRTDIGDLSLKKFENFNYIFPDVINFPEIIKDSDNLHWNDIIPFLEKIIKLPEKHHYPLYRATYLYNTALQKIGYDNELPYIHLVSAIETLGRDYKLHKNEDDDIKALVEKVKSMEFKNEIENEILDYINFRKSLLRFKTFIMDHCGQFRENKAEIPEKLKHLRISQEEIPMYLERVYKARSKYLHEGEGIIIDTYYINVENADISAVQGGVLDHREFKREDIVPYIGFYAKLFKKSIENYLDIKSSEERR